MINEKQKSNNKQKITFILLELINYKSIELLPWSSW